MTPPRRNKNTKETATSESLHVDANGKLISMPKPKPEPKPTESKQLELPFVPVPDDAVQRVVRALYDLAIGGNTSAAKLLLDVLKQPSSEPDALTVEAAMKIIQDALRHTS